MEDRTDRDRRQHERLGLAIPVRVQGYLAGGATWEELTTTVDVSERGASFTLNHRLQLGHVLRLTLPLPKRLRSFDVSGGAYCVYTLVRFVEHRGEKSRVGVLFFGQYPPRGFQDHPDGRYLMAGDPLDRPPRGAAAEAAVSVATEAPDDSAPDAPDGAVSESQAQQEVERRSAPRVDVFVNFMLQLTDTEGHVVQQELTVADNIAKGGARVMSALSFQVGDVLLLQEAGGAFSTRAEVRAVTRVQPTFERLHLRFMDRQAPDRLLR